MSIQTLSNPIEIDKQKIIGLSKGRLELKTLIQSNLPLFIFAEDTKRGKYLVGNKQSSQFYPISKEILKK